MFELSCGFPRRKAQAVLDVEPRLHQVSGIQKLLIVGLSENHVVLFDLI
jgi:hypothetical protein